MSKLYVFFKEKLVGELEKKADDTLSFFYAKSWLEDDQNNFYLSPALELRAEAFNHRETKSYFENLLPEGEIRKRLEQYYKLSLTDEYKFLEQFGLDCAGALVVSANENLPQDIDPEEVAEIDLKKLSEACEQGEDISLHVHQEYKARFSLAGAQEKVPIILNEGKAFVPTMGAATSHILKPLIRSSDTYETVFNEYFCAKLAKSVGIDVPEVQILKSDQEFYVIERYDREISEDGFERIHQFDFCQAQGIPSSEKYEEEGGPGIAENYRVLLEVSQNPIRDIEKFTDWIAFNLLIGNNDSHSKNISFLAQEDGFTLSPFYDLICTTVYKKFSQEFAFKIGGQTKWESMKRKNFEILSQDLGLHKDLNYAATRFCHMAKKLEEALPKERTKFEVKFGQSAVVEAICAEITKRIRVMTAKIQPKKGK